MRAVDVVSRPVCDNDRLLGALTDRDIAIRCMTPSVHYCFKDDDVAYTAEIMSEKQVLRLPVLNRNSRLVGIAGLGVRAGGLTRLCVPFRPDAANNVSG